MLWVFFIGDETQLMAATFSFLARGRWCRRVTSAAARHYSVQMMGRWRG